MSNTAEEIQAAQETKLAEFIAAETSPERQASMLIKIGSYRAELNKMAPMLADADPEVTDEWIERWLADGDPELKKAIWNASTGSEELTLYKAAPEEGPELELAKMVDAAPAGGQRMAVLQKIGVYTTQVQTMLGHAEGHKLSVDDTEKMLKEWLEDGDRSHEPLKKHVLGLLLKARADAYEPNENEQVDQAIGNASTHAGKEFGDGGGSSGTPDSGIRRKVPDRPTGEGAGQTPRGNLRAPNQQGAAAVAQGSGPNDTGGGEVKPVTSIQRAGATGGLGSVRGNQQGSDRRLANDGKNGAGERDDKKKKRREMDKAELASDLIKILPNEVVTNIAELAADDQVAVCGELAEHAADLMAWSDQGGDQLQKRDLDAAIADWLAKDPETVDLKKFVAEALATAEEIPLELGKAIMAWQPASVRASGLRVRQPYPRAA